jgi:alpha-L-fucosidase
MNTYYQAGYLPMSDEERVGYNKAVYQQLKELWTEYGELFEIWFDGGVMSDDNGGIATDVTKLIQIYQPHAILFQGPSSCNNLIRWVGNEDGRAPYPNWSTTDFTTSSLGKEEIIGLNGKPDGKIWCPGEADFPNRKKTAWNGGWLWHADQENFLFSADELVDRYYTSVGRNANMLIGMAIDTAGRFPEADALIFKEFGRKIKHIFEIPLARAGGQGQIVELEIAKTPRKIDHIIIQEDISLGEHIRAYRIEIWSDGGWSTICEGTSIGHKRIHKIVITETSKIRVVITKSTANPQIRNLSVYYSSPTKQ